MRIDKATVWVSLAVALIMSAGISIIFAMMIAVKHDVKAKRTLLQERQMEWVFRGRTD